MDIELVKYLLKESMSSTDKYRNILAGFQYTMKNICETQLLERTQFLEKWLLVILYREFDKYFYRIKLG